MYPHQAERLSEALERARVDALVATSRANVAYVTGFHRGPGSTDPAELLAVFARGGVALVVSSDDAVAVASADLDVDHVVCHGESFAAIGERAGDAGRRLAELTAKPASDASEALASALHALGCARGRVGLDDAALPASARTSLVRALDPERVCSASEAFATARMVKAPWEIECLQRALAIAEEAIAAVLAALAPGTTEREAAVVFERDVARASALPTRAIVAFGSNGAIAHPWPADRPARRGDLVRFDVGCVWRGYHADVARMAVLGEPAARQEALHDAVDRGVDAALATIAPGVTGARVFEAVVDAVRARGIERFRARGVGDGIGLEPTEVPRLGTGAPALEAGTVLRVSVPYHEVGWGGVTVKETLLVGRTGAVALNRSRRGLVVLDA